MSDLFINQDLLKILPTIDAVVFDLDGVLVDVSLSFPLAVSRAVQHYATQVLGLEESGTLLEPAEAQLFKGALGFSDEGDLANAAVALVVAKWTQTEAIDTLAVRQQEPSWAEFTAQVKRAGGGLKQAENAILEMLTPQQRREFARHWQQKTVTQLFREFYAGEDACQAVYGFVPSLVQEAGFYREEKALVDVALLPKHLKLGLVTSRTLAETRLAMQHAGLERTIPQSCWVTADDFVKKPFGRTLFVAREKMDFKHAIYVGNDMDAFSTIVNYRDLPGSGKGKVQSAIALTGSPGPKSQRTYLEAGAGIVTPDVNALLQFLAPKKK